MKEYIARDPKTGMPLAFGKRGISYKIDEAYRAPKGPWDAIKHYEIISICDGSIQALEVDGKKSPS